MDPGFFCYGFRPGAGTSSSPGPELLSRVMTVIYKNRRGGF